MRNTPDPNAVPPQSGPPAPQNPAPPAAPAAPVAPDFDAIERARKEERDKLYGRLDEQKNKLEEVTNELAEVRREREEREAAAAKAKEEAEAARKAKEEEELSAKELLDRQRAETEARFEKIEQERAVERAIFAKEQQRSELVSYTQQRVIEEKDNIAPEFIDLIGVGASSAEEVEASITTMKEKTASILDGVRQAQQQQRQSTPGVSPNVGNVGPVDQQDATRQFSAEEIASLSPSSPEYQKLREQYGIDRSGRGKGMFS